MSEPAKQPLSVKAVNLLGAGIEAARRLATGEQVRATPQEASARLSICHNNCPHLRADGECSLCGCPVARKVTWAGEFCDDGRWSAVRGKPTEGVITGADMLDHELELRAELPEGQLAASFNAYHARTSDTRLRCKSCEKRKLLRDIEMAMSYDIAQATQEVRLRVQAILPNRSNIMLSSLRKWENLINLKTTEHSTI